MDKREILFRGFTVDSKRWIEGDYYQDEEGDCFIRTTFQTCHFDEGLQNASKWIQVIHESVGQLSPKTDKSGIRIFENDLLLVDGHRITKVVMNDECGCWDTVFVSDSNMKIKFNGLSFSDWSTRCDVIGNLTDNPELLK